MSSHRSSCTVCPNFFDEVVALINNVDHVLVPRPCSVLRVAVINLCQSFPRRLSAPRSVFRSYPILSCPILPYPILSSIIVLRHILSFHPILSYPITFYPCTLPLHCTLFRTSMAIGVPRVSPSGERPDRISTRSSSLLGVVIRDCPGFRRSSSSVSYPFHFSCHSPVRRATRIELMRMTKIPRAKQIQIRCQAKKRTKQHYFGPTHHF